MRGGRRGGPIRKKFRTKEGAEKLANKLDKEMSSYWEKGGYKEKGKFKCSISLTNCNSW